MLTWGAPKVGWALDLKLHAVINAISTNAKSSPKTFRNKAIKKFYLKYANSFSFSHFIHQQ
jgi:hypothetical protein